jgi:hypothetical protein
VGIQLRQRNAAVGTGIQLRITPQCFRNPFIFIRQNPRKGFEEILEEHGFGPYAAEGILRILGRHDFLALDSWVRMKYRELHPGPKKKTDASIARRYARYGENRGLAMWLELTEEWHRGEESVWP